MKIVVIGAGSRVFGPRSVTDILMTPELAAEKPEIVMVDTDQEKLQQVYRLMLMIRDHLGSQVPISATPDRGQALPDADYVLIAVTQRRSGDGHRLRAYVVLSDGPGSFPIPWDFEQG